MKSTWKPTLKNSTTLLLFTGMLITSGCAWRAPALVDCNDARYAPSSIEITLEHAEIRFAANASVESGQPV